MQPIKTRIKCHSCGAGYAVDFAKLPPTVNHFKCLKCGHPVPLLARLLAPGKPQEAPPASAMKAPTPTAKHDQGAFATFDWIDRNDHLGGLDPQQDLTAGLDKVDPWLPLYGGFTVVLVLVVALTIALSGTDRDHFQAVMEAVSRAFGGPRSAPIEKSPELRTNRMRMEFQRPGDGRTPGVGRSRPAGPNEERCSGALLCAHPAWTSEPRPYRQQSIELSAITSYGADSAVMELRQQRMRGPGLAVRSVIP